MYERPYHSSDISKNTFLVTGGAGFIGSHIVEYLLKHQAGRIIVVDDLSTGSLSNIEQLDGAERVEFHKLDINQTDALAELCSDVDVVLHQAALGSVPRSIAEPLNTHAANATGFLSVLEAVRKGKVKRLIYASSSSVYGDSEQMPKVEETIGFPKSPYAITKLMDEYYANLYARIHQMEVIGLRYFNIFGPRQNPKGPYAAAIPLFILAALNSEKPTVFGDGEQSRDFTFVENAVQANMKAAFANADKCGQVYNIACGGRFTLNEIIDHIGEAMGIELEVNYSEARKGDIRHSNASIQKAGDAFGYDPIISMPEGLKQTIDWYRENLSN